MNQTHQNNFLLDSTRRPSAVIWMLAWPAIVDQLFQTAVQYVDSAMLGSLGAYATAAVAANTSTIWLVNGIMYAFGASFAVLAGRNIGAGKQADVDRIVHQALVAIAAFGLAVLSLMLIIGSRLPHWIGVEPQVVPDAVSYMRYIALSFPFTIAFMFIANLLRSAGDTKSPMIANITANIANVIGNFLLIFPTREITVNGHGFTVWGAALGVSGAAISTALSNVLAGSILLFVLFTRKASIRVFTGAPWRPQADIWRSVTKLAVPLAMERATISLGQVTLTVLVTGIGTTALAAHHLAIVAESITYLPVSGFSIAATTLVAQSLGARREEQALSFARRCLTFGVLLMTFTGSLMFLFARPLMSFFTPDAAVVALGAQVLRIEAFAEPFFALAIVGTGILRGAGDTRWPFIYSLIGMWLIRIVPAFVLLKVFNLGLQAAWACMVADLIVRGVLNVNRFVKKRWIRAWKD